MDVVCAGAVIGRDDGRIVVIRRGQAPSLGRWSIPGGRVEPGESVEDAAVREAWEETGLDVELAGVAGQVQLPTGGDDTYVVTDFHATVVGDPDQLVAGDDAADAVWATRAELEALDTTPGLAGLLAEWGVWERHSSGSAG